MKVAARTTPLEGSYNTLFCATSPAAPAQLQGLFVLPVAKVEARAETWMKETDLNARLWEDSEAKMRQLL
jgi:hypothetical protein